MSDLLCCPFCGSAPVFPDVDDVYGTYYDAGCEDCGLATISLQIIDCFDYGESPNRSDVYSSWDSDKMRYGEEFITTARENAVRQWNTRAGDAELSDLRMNYSRLLAACKNLTGSLWPQNETTEKLREVIGDLEGE